VRHLTDQQHASDDPCQNDVCRTSYRFSKENIMSDNLQERGPQDRSRINVHEEWELRYWTKELGLSADELRQAVKDAGTSVKAVREHLGKPA
jgi:hypothetical protein